MWTCSGCGEACEEQFDSCWKCESSRGIVTTLEEPLEEAEPAAAPPPLPKLPPAVPCARCGSERVIPRVWLRGMDVPISRRRHDPGLKDAALGQVHARLCVECGDLELSVDNLEGLWEAWLQSHVPSVPLAPTAQHLRPAFGLPASVEAEAEWKEQTPNPLGARVIVEPGGARGSFDAWLPLSGIVRSEVPDADEGAGWLLVELDQPFAATLKVGVSLRYQRLEVGKLLVQADLGAGRNPRAWKQIGATVIPLESGRPLAVASVKLEDYPHFFRATCSAAPRVGRS
jgi:hypothetical protein